MPEQTTIAKAVLQQISWNEDGDVVNPGSEFEVQFNPETLNLAFANQVAGGDQAGGAAIQFNSKGTTKLTFDLIFDVTDPKIAQRFSKDSKPESLNDVRRITKLVADFMQTEQTGTGKDARFIPPGVRFSWGTFRFDGVVNSITEKIDFFSEEGVPLRATLSVGITKQDVDVNFGTPDADAAGNAAAGTSPKPTPKQGGSMQDQLAKTGNPEKWQGDALANGIENPRDLPFGQPLELGTDLAASLNASLDVSAGAGISGGMSAGISGGVTGGAGFGGSIGGSLGGSFGGSISQSLDVSVGLGISGGIGVGGSIGSGLGIGGGIDLGAGADFGIDASADLALNGGIDLDAEASASAGFGF
ncbi:MAG: hypothetical protein ACI9Y1_000100 [Lentisphaeria bacterium]|jgi:hypothetical protein